MSEVSSIRDLKMDTNFKTAETKNSISKVPARKMQTPQSKKKPNMGLLFQPNTSLRKKKKPKQNQMIGRKMIFHDDMSLNDTHEFKSEKPQFRSKEHISIRFILYSIDSRINARPSYADNFEDEGLDDLLDM